MSSEHEHVATPATAGSKVVSFLARRDVLCPACGYNLRGVTQEACPECAMPLTMEDLRGKGAVMKHWVVPTLVSVVVIGLATVFLSRALVALGAVRGTPPSLRFEFIVFYVLAIGIPTLNWVSNRRAAWTRWRVRPGKPLDSWLPHVLIAMAAIAGLSISSSLNIIPNLLSSIGAYFRMNPLTTVRLVATAVHPIPLTVCYVALCVASTQERAATWARISLITSIGTFLMLVVIDGVIVQMY
jgi:hypothetical protein